MRSFDNNFVFTRSLELGSSQRKGGKKSLNYFPAIKKWFYGSNLCYWVFNSIGLLHSFTLLGFQVELQKGKS